MSNGFCLDVAPPHTIRTFADNSCPDLKMEFANGDVPP